MVYPTMEPLKKYRCKICSNKMVSKLSGAMEIKVCYRCGHETRNMLSHE